MNILHRVLLVLLMAVLPMRAAVNRAISIQAPAEAKAGNMVSVIVSASTDASDGEQIGFIHAEYSIDEGMTWTRFCSAEKSGAEFSRKASFAVNALGGMALVRVRAAFRGGVAGDVDFKGGAMQWGDSWEKWRWPPAKYAVISVPKLLIAALPIRAVSIQAPAEAQAGSTVSVIVSASTNASDGEEIGFLHADYSIDEGKTWSQFCSVEKSGAELIRKGSFAVNALGGKAIVRARVAFRGGVAGDVDFKGGAIQWGETWEKWRSPPAKYAIISVPKSLVAARPVRATVNRALSIQAPTEAAAGSTVSVTASASTDASDGEQIGFFHADYSIDEGKTWTPLCYADKAGAELSRKVRFAVNAKGGKAIVRVRAAFRGGVAGDVDYRGGAIQWGDSWQNWRSPPAKYAIIYLPKSLEAERPMQAAVKRAINIQAPAEAEAGSTVSVTVQASTDASDGEQIGIFHADYSIDEGKTWTPLYYADKAGAELSRKVSFAVNAKGGKAIVRVRAAFRGGTAGDVDTTGGAIQWSDTWEKWRSPPTKYVIIYSPKP